MISDWFKSKKQLIDMLENKRVEYRSKYCKLAIEYRRIREELRMSEQRWIWIYPGNYYKEYQDTEAELKKAQQVIQDKNQRIAELQQMLIQLQEGRI